MSELKRIDPEVRNFVNEEFRKGEGEISELEEFIKPFHRKIDLSDFNDAVDDVIDNATAETDKKLAVKIHKSLNLTRREASDPKVWNYLTVVERPDYVRARWGHRNEERFADTAKLSRNAFSRLWWTAELTKDDGSYQRTKKAMKNQDLALWIIDNNFANYKPMCNAIVDLLNEDGELIKEIGPVLNNRLSLVLMESMDYEECVRLLESIYEEIESSDSESLIGKISEKISI